MFNQQAKTNVLLAIGHTACQAVNEHLMRVLFQNAEPKVMFAQNVGQLRNIDFAPGQFAPNLSNVNLVILYTEHFDRMGGNGPTLENTLVMDYVRQLLNNNVEVAVTRIREGVAAHSMYAQHCVLAAVTQFGNSREQHASMPNGQQQQPYGAGQSAGFDFNYNQPKPTSLYEQLFGDNLAPPVPSRERQQMYSAHQRHQQQYPDNSVKSLATLMIGLLDRFDEVFPKKKYPKPNEDLSGGRNYDRAEVKPGFFNLEGLNPNNSMVGGPREYFKILSQQVTGTNIPASNLLRRTGVAHHDDIYTNVDFGILNIVVHTSNKNQEDEEYAQTLMRSFSELARDDGKQLNVYNASETRLNGDNFDHEATLHVFLLEIPQPLVSYPNPGEQMHSLYTGVDASFKKDHAFNFTVIATFRMIPRLFNMVAKEIMNSWATHINLLQSVKAAAAPKAKEPTPAALGPKPLFLFHASNDDISRKMIAGLAPDGEIAKVFGDLFDITAEDELYYNVRTVTAPIADHREWIASRLEYKIPQTKVIHFFIATLDSAEPTARAKRSLSFVANGIKDDDGVSIWAGLDMLSNREAMIKTALAAGLE